MNLYRVEQDAQIKDTRNQLSLTQPDTQEKVKTFFHKKNPNRSLIFLK